jgi:aspartyl-tRNA(Asn)/glutamyl-tRNA(Gln) amidotransferase subunit A
MSDTPHSLHEAAHAIASGRISSVELTRACIARAERLNPRLNCFIRIEEEAALRQARAADEARARDMPLGPLHGVPIAAKDMFYDPGRETSSGSRLRAGFVSTQKARVLELMESAGAVNLGALNMTEFALGPTGHNLVYGHCRNAWNTDYISGGSSSGSGTALAAGIVYGTLGSDTGGSVRLPAAANGVLGLKATYGRISRSGAMPLSWSTDHVGPLARTARDLGRLLGVLAGHDPADPSSSRRAVPDYEQQLGGDIRGLRIGIPDNYYFDDIDSPIAALIDTALKALESLGARCVPVRVPAPEHLNELSRVIVYSEAAALHGDWLRHRAAEYSPQVRTRAMTGIAIPAAAYLEAQLLRPRLLRQFVTEVYAHCDVLVTPTLNLELPTVAETDVGSNPSMWPVIARLVRCTAGFNYLGIPALSMPVGFTARGLPAALQLVSRPFSETRLLAVAEAYQSVTDWHLRRPVEPI